ncbi:hypothetical protein V8C34DRAFT_268858 [Trichoderma compactum]
MSPRRMSCSARGAPPPMPTIKPILILGKVCNISLATAAAEAVPYSPSGKTAMTTLCLPIFPRA